MKMKKRFLSILLSLVMVLGLMPGMSLTAYGADTTYSLWVGGTQVTSANATSNDHPTWSYNADTKILTLNGYNNDQNVHTFDSENKKSAAIYTTENLTINLIGTNTVSNPNNSEESKGYAVNVLGNLKISGSGTLNASSGYRCIFAGDYEHSSTLTIDGGTVNVTGSKLDESLGIGTSNGLLTISGGTVSVTDVNNGIDSYSGVLITGGNITTTVKGSAISGGGTGGVTIEGGEVTATGTDGVGISSGSSVTISGGKVTASGGDRRGAVYGYGGVTISAGTVSANGTEIGILTEKGEIAISGGEVTASGGKTGIWGKGIQDFETQQYSGGSVAISGGKVTVSGGEKGIVANGGITFDTGMTILAGDNAASAATVTTYEGQKYLMAQTPHTHSFTYSASGATITAKCTAEGCTLPPSTDGGSDHVATLTIGAPTLTYVGQTGQNISAEATITDANGIKGSATVKYYNAKADGTDKDGQELGNAPTDAGKYWAEITLTNADNSSTATAHVVYSIGYAVTFDTHGGSEVPMQVVEKGENATRPTTDPTNGNLIFGDWYTNDSFETRYGFGRVTENTTVHAKWGEHEVNWVFYTNSGTGNYTVRDVFTGQAPAVDSFNSIMVDMLDEMRPAGTSVVGWKTETDAGNVTYNRVYMKAPTAKTLTYDSSAQALVNEGVVYGSEMQYAIGTDDQTAPSEGWDTSIPAKTDAGTYYVWYKVKGGENHNDTAPACLTVTIGPAAPTITGADLVLDGTLTMRFYVALPTGFNDSGAHMVLTIRDRNYDIPFADAKTSADTATQGQKIFSCPVYSIEMAEPVAAVFHYTKGGEDKTATRTASIKDYLDALDAQGGQSAQLSNLIAAVRNYGHYIQPYLARLHKFTVGEGGYAVMPAATAPITPATAAELEGFKTKWNSYNAAVLDSVSYYDTFSTSTILNMQVKLKDAKNVTATVDGISCEVTKLGSKMYGIQIPGIAANNLDKEYNVVFSAGGDVFCDINASALTYVRTVLASDRNDDDEINALSAFYRYYEAAEAYDRATRA